jgi:cytochrome c
MRISVLALALATAAVLTGCGQSSSQSDQAAAPAAPVQPTADQIKTLLAQLPAPYNAGDIVNGKSKFTQCAACHTTAQGGPNLTGPNLYGIFGRKAGSVDGFAYSDAMKAAGWIWDAPRLDTWITNPHAVLATTKMSFPGLKDPKDRTDVIAYLKTATSPLPQ